MTYFILQFMGFSHIELKMSNISFSRAEDGFDRIFSEPAQSKFTSTLVQCLRERNVSSQLGQKEKYTRHACYNYLTILVVLFYFLYICS